ncbi:MAG TPA: hypothetical protein VHB02_15020 [Acidimicrobiales bacterium]|nr:hypothetical protein [Acidimicrobiales bacterium]
MGGGTGSPDEAALVELLAGTVAVPSPAGGERAVAEWIGGWLATRHPEVDCTVDRFAPGRANVVCRVGEADAGDLVLYSHLDTSLSGDPALDRPAVPAATSSGFERRGDLVSGPGVAVAKGPAAAATVGFLAAVRALAASGRRPRATLLLAAGGTHRATPPGVRLPAGSPGAGAGDGVRRFLAGGRPAAAVVAKAGPAGILWEEPGAAYVTVEVAGPPGLVMTRSTLPGGGVPGAVGAAVAAVERWRRRFLDRPVPGGGQAGREVGVGALAAGLPYKADVVGGLLQLHLYAVLAPGDDPAALPAELEAAVDDALARDGWTGLQVQAHLVDGLRAAATPPSAPVVRLAEAVYREAFGPPPTIAGWTGSTDGVLFRHAGVDTARLGPTPLPGRVGTESLSLSDLVAWSRAYARLVVRHSWATGPGVGP